METSDKHIILHNINLAKNLLTDMKKAGIIDDKQVGKLTSSLSDVYMNLSKPLIVTLVGPFSSGKTTFINAIIQERVLPERILPCTGMVCKIGYCDSHLKIQYLENGVKIKKEIRVDELRSFVDISDPAYRSRGIGDVLEIFHKNDFCAKDIVLVDTPGFNDPNFQDDMTNRALEKADAVIYCMSAIHAYSNTDVEKIKNLHQRKIDSIFYVVGFMDILHSNDSDTGSDEIVSFKKMITNKLASHTSLGEDGVFFVSAIDEFNKISKKTCILDDNGIEKVRIKLWKYLQDNRIQIKTKNARNHLSKIGTRLEKKIKAELDSKKNEMSVYEKNIISYQRNKEDAKKCMEAISNSCAAYEEEVYSFVRVQIETELQSIMDNMDKWVDEVFDYTSIISLSIFKNGEIQEKIDVIQRRCAEKIQKAIRERIIPYINTSTNRLQADIQHLVEKYIIVVNLEKNQSVSSVALHLNVKENPLYPSFSPLPLAATLVMLEKSAIGITALSFAPLVGVLAALGLGMGLGIFQQKRIKRRMITSIKEQLQSYSLVSRYVNAIMDSIQWKDSISQITSSLSKSVVKCDKHIDLLKKERDALVIDINRITEIENEREHLFGSIN